MQPLNVLPEVIVVGIETEFVVDVDVSSTLVEPPAITHLNAYSNKTKGWGVGLKLNLGRQR